MVQNLNIVADIGGTNTRIGLCDGIELVEGTIQRYRNANFLGVESILRDYLSDKPGQPMAICIDMAGPVRNGLGTLTNLNWTVDVEAIKQSFGASVVELLNDLQAQGHAIPYLCDDSLSLILPGENTDPGTTQLVINVGTGLNAALVLNTGGQTLVPAAEAGHVTLQAINEEERRLRDWIAMHNETPGVEDILSGRGLERLYAWVCQEEGGETSKSASEIMSLFNEDEPWAHRTIALFVRFFGRYAGDLALITLPTAGIYLVGGVIQNLGPHLLRMGFAEVFEDKGRFSPVIRQFPVHLVIDDYAALRGCACHLNEVLTATRPDLMQRAFQ